MSSRCKQGDAILEAEDWETGEAVSIPLDKKEGPVKTAEALFARARKQRRAVEHLGPLLQVRCTYLSDPQNLQERINHLSLPIIIQPN